MCDLHGAGLGAAIQSLLGSAPVLPVGTAPTTVVAKANHRIKLWELEDKHHCPVVGTCLTLDEIKKLARKGGFVAKDADDYRLHVEAVSLSCSRNPVAEAMHKRLDRKFDLYLRRFDKACDETEVHALWKQHLEQGEVAGAMWAALTHKAGGKESRHVVYADVHMLSHQIGAGQAADLRRLEWLEREHATLREQARAENTRQARELAEKTARIQELERTLAEAWQRAQEAGPLRARVEQLESGLAMTDMARRLLAASDAATRLETRNTELEQRLVELTERLAILKNHLEITIRERDAMERLWSGESAGAVAAGIDDEPGCDGECETCPNNLRVRCVLCVGGRAPLLPQYRQLAERLGVRLIHHDGGREEALSRLPALLASSDAVICPTDSVGHLAYYQLKQHCKLAGKPYALVKSSGIASFAAALTRLAGERGEIAAEA